MIQYFNHIFLSVQMSYTALVLASMHGNQQIFNILMEAGANIETEGYNG